MGGHSSRRRVAPPLKQPTRAADRNESICRPYSVLHPVGFTVPPLLPKTRCALAAPFRPYPSEAGRYAFCGTIPDPGRSRNRRALPGTAIPWSPDFPRASQARPAAARPSGEGGYSRFVAGFRVSCESTASDEANRSSIQDRPFRIPIGFGAAMLRAQSALNNLPTNPLFSLIGNIWFKFNPKATRTLGLGVLLNPITDRSRIFRRTVPDELSFTRHSQQIPVLKANSMLEWY